MPEFTQETQNLTNKNDTKAKMTQNIPENRKRNFLIIIKFILIVV